MKTANAKYESKSLILHEERPPAAQQLARTKDDSRRSEGKLRHAFSMRATPRAAALHPLHPAGEVGLVVAVLRRIFAASRGIILPAAGCSALPPRLRRLDAGRERSLERDQVVFRTVLPPRQQSRGKTATTPASPGQA